MNSKIIEACDCLRKRIGTGLFLSDDKESYICNSYDIKPKLRLNALKKRQNDGMISNGFLCVFVDLEKASDAAGWCLE